MSRKAFTLIELLIVVLIIGVLSAIAIPMYQGAVDKSHWSTMLPGAKAIKDAEEAFKMSNDGYTSEMGNLDVTMENSDLTFNLITPNNTSDPNVIRVTNSKLANVRLASYLNDNPKFAGQLHCEAVTGDERANRLCGGLLQGQELTSADGYTGYLLDQSIDKATCDNASRSWSTSKTKCYKDTATRCTDLGMGVIASMDDQCGYENGVSGQVVGAEGICIATGGNSCNGVIVKDGGKCQGQGAEWACRGAHIQEGGVCIGCRNPIIEEGGVLYHSNGGARIQQGGACVATKDTTTGDPCRDSAVNGGAVICNTAQKNYCGYGATFDNGGICVANGLGNACWGATLTNNSICYANVANSTCDTSQYAHVSYDETSCCCGDYCGASRQCSSARCAEAIAPYQKYFDE